MLSAATRIEEFTSSPRASGGRENAASSTRPALAGSLAACPASVSASSFLFCAFISCVRNTHPSGILQVNPKPGLRYTPLLTDPASSRGSAPGTALRACRAAEDWLEED